MYMCMYVCVCIYLYICIYMYTYITLYYFSRTPAVSRQIPHALHEPATLLGLNPLLSTCWGVPVGQLAPAGYRFSKGDGFLGTESESA